MELKIPQLTPAKIAQMGRHETVNTRSGHYSARVKGSIPVRGNFTITILIQFWQNWQNDLFKENLKYDPCEKNSIRHMRYI